MGPKSQRGSGDTVTETALVLHPPLLCSLQPHTSLTPIDWLQARARLSPDLGSCFNAFLE